MAKVICESALDDSFQTRKILGRLASSIHFVSSMKYISNHGQESANIKTSDLVLFWFSSRFFALVIIYKIKFFDKLHLPPIFLKQPVA